MLRASGLATVTRTSPAIRRNANSVCGTGEHSIDELWSSTAISYRAPRCSCSRRSVDTATPRLARRAYQHRRTANINSPMPEHWLKEHRQHTTQKQRKKPSASETKSVIRQLCNTRARLTRNQASAFASAVTNAESAKERKRERERKSIAQLESSSRPRAAHTCTRRELLLLHWTMQSVVENAHTPDFFPAWKFSFFFLILSFFHYYTFLLFILFFFSRDSSKLPTTGNIRWRSIASKFLGFQFFNCIFLSWFYFLRN